MLPVTAFDDPEGFLRDLTEIEQASEGTLCWAARDLQTGRTLGHRADYKCKTASVIKLPVLLHIALCVEEGTRDWNETLTLTNAEKVDGSGVLTQLSAGLPISLRDVCVLMTIVSDNTATNMAIEHVGIEAVNRRMRDLGLPVTTVFRKAYAPDTDASREFGLGVTTPNEMLTLLTGLANGSVGSDATRKTIWDILAQQHYRDTIPRLLPADWQYAGKTGAVDAVRNDVGLVTTPDGRRYALALFCQDIGRVLWTADNPGLLALARLSRRVLQND